MPRFTIQVQHFHKKHVDQFDVDAPTKDDAERQAEYLRSAVGVTGVRAVKSLVDRQADNAKFDQIRYGPQPIPEDSRIFNQTSKPIAKFFSPYTAYMNTGPVELPEAGDWKSALYQAVGYADAHECMVEMISDGKTDRRVEYIDDTPQYVN